MPEIETLALGSLPPQSQLDVSSTFKAAVECSGLKALFGGAVPTLSLLDVSTPEMF